ncbi:NAD(P)H-dependent flavin oxidoreductase [Roseibium sp.]|uniref:NAD(P)H-dependent flavin oxidoreductase n=1 Tax=Roseibium sp. TaxID=1936156 RepID=UPI003D0A22C0
MFSTRIMREFGLKAPIVNAGMAMVARPELAAAVCNAGGLGTIGSDINPPEVLRDMIRETKALTDRSFGVDLIGDFVEDGHIDVLIEERVALAIFFWRLPSREQVRRLQRSRVKVWIQVGDVAEAAEAVALGIDGLVVQGAEAGGHNRSEASTMTLFPRLRGLYPDLPMLAAGGIVDGTTMAAALALGADAVWCGSRFLAAEESAAHETYKAKAVAADVGETAVTQIYGPEWPDQAMRVIINKGFRETFGRETDAVNEAAGVTIGTTVLNGETIPLPRFSAILPTRDFDGDIEQACLTAGQSVGNIDAVMPASTIIRQMMSEANEALQKIIPRTQQAD